MDRVRIPAVLAAAVCAAFVCGTARAEGAAAPAKSDAELIANAMRAGPASISANATVMMMNADGSMRTLRKGTNGYTCMPDSGMAPGPDAMCSDGPGMRWLGAYMDHKAPPANAVGMIYMLAGGTDASNTDPWAEKPAAGKDWLRTGPHVMIVGADPAFYQAYPSGENVDPAVPYVMWAGTPWQHLMAPTR